MNERPLIGITAFETQHAEPPHSALYALNQCYVHAVEATGGAGLILPPGLGQASLRRAFERLDGLLLSGGGDIDPACYGQPPHPALARLSAARDRIELALARWAVEERKPVLCICRGIQVLNVALGGSLIQDISTQRPGALQHDLDDKVLPRDHIAHEVEVEPGSRLAGVLGVERARVNSWHHQAIDRLAGGLRVAARSPDGIVEAVEGTGPAFVVGVQWHPECLYDRQAEMKRLFAALVAAAAVEVEH